jgi:hypothetical protein
LHSRFMKRSLLPILLGLLVLSGCGDDDSPAGDVGLADAADAMLDGGSIDSAGPDGSQPDAGEADVSLPDGGAADVVDPPGDAGPADSGPGLIIGDGMRCEVASAYNPTDIASQGAFHWLAAGDRIVRVDESFGNPVEELVTDGVVSELHATEDHLVAHTGEGWLRREPDGTWVELSPMRLGRVTGNRALFALSGTSLLRYDGAWTTIEPPAGVTISTSLSVHDDYVFMVVEENEFWVHDGTSWSSHSTSTLSDVPGPPQPAARVTLEFVRALSATEFVFEYSVTRNFTTTWGLATFEAGVLTILSDEIPNYGVSGYFDGQYVNVNGTLVSDDGENWRPSPYPASFEGWPGPTFIADQETLWAVASWGVYRLNEDTWEQAMAPSMPATLLSVSPDARLAPAPAYGVIDDRDMGRLTFVRWDGSWSATEVEGPPTSPYLAAVQLAWAGDVAYYLQRSVSDEYRIIAHRWHAGVDETLGGYRVGKAVFANRFGVYMTVESGGGFNTYVHQAIGDGFPRHSTASGCWANYGLVLAGPGLVIVGCDFGSGGITDSVWWDGTDWNIFSRSTHQGYVDDGTTQTAIFRTEAEPYIWSAYDGTDWTTPDVSWAPESAHFEGAEFDQVVASYPNGLSWKRGEDVATAEDSRFGPAQGVVTSERALLMAGTRERRYTFDCVPEL